MMVFHHMIGNYVHKEIERSMALKGDNQNKFWRITLKNKGTFFKKSNSFLIEADGYSESDIRKILNETHPEWEIGEVSSKPNDTPNESVSSAI